MNRTRQLVAGAAALTAGIVLVVGIPAGLIGYVGWPLPERLPSLDEISLALRSGIDPQLLIKILAIVVWVAWLQMVAALAFEVAAAIRGRTAPKAPVLPVIQIAAARLVAMITLAAATLAPMRPDVALAHPPPAVTVQAETSSPVYSIRPDPTESKHLRLAEPAVRPVFTVGRFDTLWTIADTTLGDGRRWTEIRDLNIGRHTSTGVAITQATEHVPPGTTLDLPGDATVPTTDEQSTSSEVTVQGGDSFWTIAQEALLDAWGRQPTNSETAVYWSQLIHTNRDRLQPPYDPDLIYPGQVFQLPPTDTVDNGDLGTGSTERSPSPDSEPEAEVQSGSDSESEAVTPEATGGARTPEQSSDEPAGDEPVVDQPVEAEGEPAGEVTTPTPDLQSQSDEPTDTDAESEIAPPAADDANQDTPLLPIAAGIAGLGLLAAGTITLLDRLRRVQLRQRRPGTIPTPPPATTVETENTLRAAAAPTATELISLSLRALAQQLTDGHTPSPQVVGVHLSEELVRLLLWTPHQDPPPGWQVDDNGSSWTLPTTVDPTYLHFLADTTPAPYPALVTVGHDDNGAQLLLDLEHLGATQVTGESDHVAAALHTIAVELATSEIADMLDVVCVGFGGDLTHLERISAVDELSDILPDIERRAAVLAKQDVNPLEGRLAPGGDAWAPIVVLDPRPEQPDGAEKLLAVAHRGRAVCAVVGYPTGGRWRLHVADGSITIHPLGYTYHRRDLTPTEQTGIADLTLAAKDLDGIPQPLVAPPSAIISQQPELSRLVGEGEGNQLVGVTSEDTTPEVKVLGTVRVDGITERFPEAKALELVTYLVLHRNGSEPDTILEALFPGQSPRPQRLSNLAHKARNTLGDAPDGTPYVPYFSRTDPYQISPHLQCDLERFTRHIQTADETDDPESLLHLQAALEIVEGPPFTVRKGYAWAHSEGITTHAVVAIDNAAHRLATLALDRDEPELITWAARKGLTASWACEECYRNLMRAAIAQHDQTALEAIYSELNSLLEEEQGPDTTDWLEPETVDLYHQHAQRRRNAG